VVISWRTDKEAGSLVAMAPAASYDPVRDEPYIQIVGNTTKLAVEHRVKIFGLEADTLYHFQLRNKGKLGPVATSKDFTFRTKLESLKISNYWTQIINDETAVFKWVTNLEADSSVRFAPYRGKVLAVDEAKVFKETALSVIHQIIIKEFQAGV